MDKASSELTHDLERTRISTAFHEAGHAVIGRKLGLACGEVTIVPDEESLGGAIIENPLGGWERGDGSRRALVEAFCIALFAGAEAERLVNPGEILVGDGMDRERITGALKEIGISGAAFVGDDTWERYEGRLQRRGRELVKLHRIEIERVASALVDRNTLTAHEISSMLDDGEFRER